MTRLLRRLFHRIYRVPGFTPLAAETICSCGTVAHPADYFCAMCGARIR